MVPRLRHLWKAPRHRGRGVDHRRRLPPRAKFPGLNLRRSRLARRPRLSRKRCWATGNRPSSRPVSVSAAGSGAFSHQAGGVLTESVKPQPWFVVNRSSRHRQARLRPPCRSIEGSKNLPPRRLTMGRAGPQTPFPHRQLPPRTVRKKHSLGERPRSRLAQAEKLEKSGSAKVEIHDLSAEPSPTPPIPAQSLPAPAGQEPTPAPLVQEVADRVATPPASAVGVPNSTSSRPASEVKQSLEAGGETSANADSPAGPLARSEDSPWLASGGQPLCSLRTEGPVGQARPHHSIGNTWTGPPADRPGRRVQTPDP